MASLAGRGRAKIRPPRRGLANNDVDFDETWGVLEKAFKEIHTKNASALSFEELYRNAYKIVLKKKGDELYKRVAQFEEIWLAKNVRTKVISCITAPLMMLDSASGRSLATPAETRQSGDNFLRELKGAWEDHQVCMSMLTDVLMYMDRVYCQDSRQPSIFAKSMGLFRDQILRAPVRADMESLLAVLTRIILDQIRMDREGDHVTPSLIKANIFMLEGLYDSDLEVEDEKLYLTAFETDFLASSADFYRTEGERLLRESDAGTYCTHAKRRIDEEQNRCRSTLSESTAPKIQRVVEDELIRHKMKGLIEMDSGVEYMVDNDKLLELGYVFDLEARVDPKKTELTKAIQKIVMEMGANITNAAVAASAAPTAPTVAGANEEQAEEKSKTGAAKVNQVTMAALKWAEDILALKDRFDNIWRQAFQSDQMLQIALNRSMADTINSFNRSSEYISLFIDDNMKKGIRNKTDAEVDSTLEKAIILLRYLQDKDLFETYYKKHLCKRLLLNKSQSISVEKQMISKMKIELGNSFTLKLEAMFKDMTLSEELTNGFKTYVNKLGDTDRTRVDLGINVLTSMTWPLEAFRGGAAADEDQGNLQIIFPAQIDRVKTGFTRFYNEKHSGRKLTWQTNMGDADIKATFAKAGKDGKPRTHDINCSTYAMLILLLFNDLPTGASLAFEEIQAATNIPPSDLARNLQSLAVAPKTRFLVKEPMSREINPGDRFSYNENFKSPFVKIKVGVVSAGNKVEGDRERKETEKKNNDSRGYVIEACVVRIMKQRKLLAHTALLNETITQLSAQFKPDVNMIKKKIESLIEREYLERVEEAAVPSYRYLA